MDKNEILKYRNEQEEKRRKQNEAKKIRKENEEIENALTHKAYEKPEEYEAIKILILKGIIDLLILAFVLFIITILNLSGASDISFLSEANTYMKILKITIVGLLILKIIMQKKLWYIIDPSGQFGLFLFIILDIISLGMYPLICIYKKTKKSKREYILYKEQQKQIKAAMSSGDNKYIERIKTEFAELLKKTEKLKTENYIVKRIKISEMECNLYANLRSMVKNVTSKIEKETGFSAIVQIYKFVNYNGRKTNTVYTYDIVKTDPLDNDKHLGTKEITVLEGDDLPNYKEPININSTLTGTRKEYDYYGYIKEEYIMDIVIGIEKYDKPYYGDVENVQTSFIFTSEGK